MDLSKQHSDAIISDFMERTCTVWPQIDFAYLFGSRARGDERPASDYDLMIVLKEAADKRAVKDVLYDHATDIFLESGKDISMKVMYRSAFEDMEGASLPFIQNVLREGVRLG